MVSFDQLNLPAIDNFNHQYKLCAATNHTHGTKTLVHLGLVANKANVVSHPAPTLSTSLGRHNTTGLMEKH